MITSQQIAATAVVHLSDEFLMELGRPVDVLVANRVMSAFSALAKRNYTIADVSVSLKSETVRR